MDKLTGEQYINHWTKRMAKGPLEAGTESNAEEIWNFIRPHLVGFTPQSVLEQGCAYGRMLRRIQREWPKATLYGADVCREALEHLRQNWLGDMPIVYNQSTPPRLKVDMIFTCTVLQHITDDDVLQKVADGFREALNPGGRLVLYENIQWAHGGGGAHMRHFGPQDYMNFWPELVWKDCGTLAHAHDGQRHELMIGTKIGTRK